MSSASVTSSKREDASANLMVEIDSIRALNSSLRTYLEHLRVFKKNLVGMNNNCIELSKVNSQWVDTLKMMR